MLPLCPVPCSSSHHRFAGPPPPDSASGDAGPAYASSTAGSSSLPPGPQYPGTGSASPVAGTGLRLALVLSVSYPEFEVQVEPVLIEHLSLALNVSAARWTLLVAAPASRLVAAIRGGTGTAATEVWFDVWEEGANGDHEGTDTAGPGPGSGAGAGAGAGAGGTPQALSAAAVYELLALEVSGGGSGRLAKYEATARITGVGRLCADGRTVQIV